MTKELYEKDAFISHSISRDGYNDRRKIIKREAMKHLYKKEFEEKRNTLAYYYIVREDKNGYCSAELTQHPDFIDFLLDKIIELDKQILREI